MKQKTFSIALGATLSLLLTFSSGCSSTQPAPAHTLTVGGLERTYHLFAPTGESSQPKPLLIAFHGGGMIGDAFPQQTQFQTLGQAQGFLMAFPQGYALEGNEGEWQLNTRPDSQHDIDFVKAVIEDVASKHNVDRKRIYVTGYSLGSMFSYEMACQLSDQVAAIASSAGTMPQSPADCSPQRFAPIMHIHGDADGIISYSNSWGWKSWDEVGTMMDIPSLIAYWKTKYGCQNENATTAGTSTHTVHDTCTQNARVEHYRISGQSHGWPDTIGGISTHQVIWSFLSGFSLP